MSKKNVDPKEVQKLAAMGLTQEQIGDWLGVSGRTFRRWKEADPEIDRAYRRGRAKAIATVAHGVMLRAMRVGTPEEKDKDLTASFFVLKTQAGWHETSRLEVDGNLTLEQALAELDDGDEDADDEA